MLKKCKKIIVILATCCSALAFGQIAPVSSRTTFTPPYSAQISEWAEKISLTLLLRDLSVQNGEVFVRMHIESANVSLETRPLFGSRNFQLDGGVPLQISGNELANLFMPENLVFSGMTRENFIRNGSRLPEARYRLWFTVYESGSGIQVSASENFAIINIHAIDPPTLNFPKNNSLIFAETSQNILFSWTPRHKSAVGSGFRGVYDFELVKIPKNYIGDLQILFQTTQKHSEKTLFQTQFRYTDFDEELVKNERYAWRVRVRSIDDNESFQLRNNGYSEIFTFRYAENCENPKSFLGFPDGPYRANLSWMADDFRNQYLILYRRAGDETNAWFSRRTSLLEITLDDLSPNQTYEIKIRTLCEFTNSDDSDPIFITTPALSDENRGCGMSFAPSDSCENPLEIFTVQDVFTSGGTTIYLTEISGSDGIFSGKGYIRMPLLDRVRLNVTFENIRINECFEHTDGIIHVVYDETDNLFADLDAYFEGGNFSHDKDIGDDCQTEFFVNFSLDESNVEKLPNGDVQIGSGGSVQVIPSENLPTTVQDRDGKIYEITPNGEINLLAQTSSKDLKSLRKDTTQQHGRILFSKHPDQITAFDEWRDYYGNSVLIRRHYEKFNDAFISYQLIEARKGGVVQAFFDSRTDSLDPEKIMFRNGKNTVFQAKLIDENTFDISLVGSAHGELQVISAVYIKDSTEIILGKLFVPAFEKRSHTVKIVPTFGQSFNFEKMKTDMKRIFASYLVELNIVLDSAFTSMEWDLNGNGVLDVLGSNRVSTLTDEMRAINRLYCQERETDQETLYLFLFEKSPSNRDGISIAGDMPRGSQFGYLFLDASDEMLAKTAAHEIGHGLFNLKHTFDNDYRIAKNSTDNLMDYGNGTFLSYWQWLQLFDPPTVWGLFEDDEDKLRLRHSNNKVIEILNGIRDANVFDIEEIAYLGRMNFYGQNVLLEDGKRYSFLQVTVFEQGLIDPSQRNIAPVTTNIASDRKFVAFSFWTNNKKILEIRTHPIHQADLENFLFDFCRERWYDIIAKKMFDNGPFQNSPRIYNSSEVMLRLTRITSNQRKALNVYRNVFYTLIPYGYVASLADNLIIGDVKGGYKDAMGIAAKKADKLMEGELGKLISQSKSAKGKFMPFYYAFKEINSPETNRERLERLVFQHLVNQQRCNLNVSNRGLLDCDRRNCRECSLMFVRKYANLTYSLFEKTYILNSEADYRAAEADIRNRQATIDQMIRFYLNRL